MKISYDSYVGKPTSKQLAFISVIEKQLGVKYTGKSKIDAQKFISVYYNDFKYIDTIKTVGGVENVI